MADEFEKEKSLSRRSFLKMSGVATGSLVAGTYLGSLIPEDDLGPGALALGVGWFIDHELASGYGDNKREYMKGPFKEGTPYQGPQYPLLRRDLYDEGIRVMNETSQKDHDALFHELEAEQ